MTRIASYFSTAGTMAFVFHVINELRGAALAVPLLLTIYRSGGAWMAIWLGICSIAGIAITVLGPWFAINSIKRRLVTDLRN